MQGPMPEGQAPDAGAQAPGGASQLVADTHSNLLKLQELVQGSMPEEAQVLGQIIQAYQQFVDGLGQGPNSPKPKAPGPSMTSPEAGAADVQPV